MSSEKHPARSFETGENFTSHTYFGCHPKTVDGKQGFVFRVWAPNAQQIWLVGDFNEWDRTIPLTKTKHPAIWEGFSERPQIGDLYKYLVKQNNGREVYKIDPFAIAFEKRPNSAAIVQVAVERKWTDHTWRKSQTNLNSSERPLNIYEVHAGSWQAKEDGTPLTFKELKETLIPYAKKLGYSHIEFMPLMEHPLGASWGYQLTGYFSLSSNYGTIGEFQEFVDACHLNDLGVIIDWVPGHFCINDDGLAYFDGSAQFEYANESQAKNIRWGALNFDLAKPEVQSFLISSAFYWIDTFHIDGIRVDAVSNMLYLDYDEPSEAIISSEDHRNWAGFYFLQKLNAVIKQKHPQIIMIAEESSSEIKITGNISDGTLGFDYKWNLGWMNDTLCFYQMDAAFRKYNFHRLTFSLMYMFQEKYILPLSHDEVVHGKRSLMHKMWGDRYKQFAQLRNLYVYQMTFPGKKLLFMGSEWGQFLEWKHDEALEWIDLNDVLNQRMQYFTEVLNRLYTEEKALWELEQSEKTIEIIDANNAEATVLSFIRKGKREKDFLIIALNFSPVEHKEFILGVPFPGIYQEVLNTEMNVFGGTWTRKNQDCQTQKKSFKSFEYQIQTIIPALGGIIIKPKEINTRTK